MSAMSRLATEFVLADSGQKKTITDTLVIDGFAPCNDCGLIEPTGDMVDYYGHWYCWLCDMRARS